METALDKTTMNPLISPAPSPLYFHMELVATSTPVDESLFLEPNGRVSSCDTPPGMQIPDSVLMALFRLFQSNPSFVLLLFDLQRRRSAFFKRNLYTQSDAWQSVEPLIQTVTSERLLDAAATARRHESIDDQGVRALLKSVSRLGCTAPGSDAKKATSLPRLKSGVVGHGLPIIFMTINPGERYSPLSLLYAGTEINVEDFVPEWFPYLERMRSMLADPLAVVDYFHNTVAEIIAAVIEGGMFGEGAHYYGVIEYQGRGTPHIHILVSIPCHFISTSTDILSSYGYRALDPLMTYVERGWMIPISERGSCNGWLI